MDKRRFEYTAANRRTLINQPETLNTQDVTIKAAIVAVEYLY